MHCYYHPQIRNLGAYIHFISTCHLHLIPLYLCIIHSGLKVRKSKSLKGHCYSNLPRLSIFGKMFLKVSSFALILLYYPDFPKFSTQDILIPTTPCLFQSPFISIESMMLLRLALVSIVYSCSLSGKKRNRN